MTEPAGATSQGRAEARGRPRDAARDRAILDAVAELLSEVGYDRLSIDAVAVRAGVARTTVYRRWADRAALTAALVERRVASPPPALESNDVRGALLAAVTWLGQQMADQDFGLLGAVLAARRSDPALAAALRPVLRHDEASMSEPLRRAAAHSGERLREDFARVLSELAPALLLHENLTTGAPPPPDRLAWTIDRLLLPLLLER